MVDEVYECVYMRVACWMMVVFIVGGEGKTGGKKERKKERKNEKST